MQARAEHRERVARGVDGRLAGHRLRRCRAARRQPGDGARLEDVASQLRKRIVGAIRVEGGEAADEVVRVLERVPAAHAAQGVARDAGALDEDRPQTLAGRELVEEVGFPGEEEGRLLGVQSGQRVPGLDGPWQAQVVCRGVEPWFREGRRRPQSAAEEEIEEVHGIREVDGAIVVGVRRVLTGSVWTAAHELVDYPDGSAMFTLRSPLGLPRRKEGSLPSPTMASPQDPSARRATVFQ